MINTLSHGLLCPIACTYIRTISGREHLVLDNVWLIMAESGVDTIHTGCRASLSDNGRSQQAANR